MSDIYIASFDIGYKNFAFYVEECNIDMLSESNDTNTDTNDEEKLNDVFMNGTTVVYENTNIDMKKVSSNQSNKSIKSSNKSSNQSKPFDYDILHNLTTFLDGYSHIWEKCEIFIIEQQMQFGYRKTNIKALKIAQHCWSYFSLRYGKDKMIVDFPSSCKTKILCPTEKMNKTRRKKWCVEKSIEIFIQRGDDEMIDFLTSKGVKKDDVADCVVQLQAYKFSVLSR
jgi:hypothetical protein